MRGPGSIEIVNTQERSDATRQLPTNNACLLVAVSKREQNTCLASLGTYNNPTLRATIIRQRWRVLR
jgi:hypothetical protein